MIIWSDGTKKLYNTAFNPAAITRFHFLLQMLLFPEKLVC